jgi:hypothetical protein
MDPSAPWLISGLGMVEFLSHGVPYVFPAKIGELTRGIPTAYAAAFVREAFSTTQSSPVLVWPIAGGPAKGNRMDPLHSCQLAFVKKPEFDPVYRALVCIDLIRIGQARERAWAVKKVADLINDA